MEAKGSIVTPTPEFIKEKFGEDGLNKWLDNLSADAQKVYRGKILPTNWYSIKDILVEPTLKMCELFFNSDTKGAWELGRFIADYNLKGIYKTFIKIGSTKFLINKASQILPTFYQAATIEIHDETDTSATLHITKLPGTHEIVEKRIAGWIERALEISGSKNPKVNIAKSLTNNDSVTEIKVEWEK